MLARALIVTLLAAAALRAAEPDLSSPKAAARSLFNAIITGDRDAVTASFYATTAEQKELASAMAGLIVAGKKLGDAARDRFGQAGDPIGRGMLDPADVAKIDDAEVTESGDAATMTLPGQPRPMSFRRQDGRWKLVVTDYAAAAPDNIARQIRLVTLMAEALDTSTKELVEGKYKSADEARATIQQRLHGVMLTFHRPATTRATTQPQ